jgi:hypothetical protein
LLNKALGVLLLLFFEVGALTSTSSTLTTYCGDATGWNNAKKIVVDHSGMIHIVYQTSLTPAQERDRFAYARSRDGLLWEVMEMEGRWPAIAIDGDRIYIAFIVRGEEDQLWLFRAAPDSQERQLILNPTPRSLFYPALAVESSSVHLAWEAHREGKSYIEYARVVSPKEAVFETLAESSQGLYFPSLAVGPDGLHLVWEEGAGSGLHRIVHAQQGDGDWTSRPISSPEIDAHYPALDYDSERQVYELVFASYSSSGNGIYYRALREGDWEEPQLLSRELESGYWTFPTVEDGLVVWGQTVAAGCAIGPLYWIYLSKGGWNMPQALEGEFAAFPHLFRKGDIWHLIWTDRDSRSPILRVIKYLQLAPTAGDILRDP